MNLLIKNTGEKRPALKSAMTAIGLAFALTACTNGTVLQKGSSNSQNQDPIVDPTPTSVPGSMTISANIIGAFINPYSGDARKGVLLSITKPMTTLGSSYGGLTNMLKQATSDASFGANVVTIRAQSIGVEIEIPLSRLNAGSGTLYNGVIIRPDGRISLVHSHALPDESASVRQTHSSSWLSVYGGMLNSDPSDRIIRLPLTGGIGIPGYAPDNEGSILFSYHTDKSITISVNPNDYAAGALRNGIQNMINDMRWLNRNTYSANGADTACTDVNNYNADVDRLLSNQSSAFVISRRQVAGVWEADEVMLCGDDANGKLMCRPYCWNWVTATTNYCGTTRSILGCDTTKKGYLSPILQAVEPMTLPATVTIHSDPDGTGQIKVRPI